MCPFDSSYLPTVPGYLYHVVQMLQLPGRASPCCPLSVAPGRQMSAAAQAPDQTCVTAGAASWLDDFMSWLEPGLPMCCR